MKNFRALVLLISILWLTGCVNRTGAEIVGDADLRQAEVFYVEHFEPDRRNFHEQISDQINIRGFKSTAGEAGNTPENADVVVTYRDNWMWDITNYMIQLSITFRDPEAGFPLVVGESYHSSLTRLSPEAMIKEVLDNIFVKIEGN